jgi:hypothetical protein
MGLSKISFGMSVSQIKKKIRDEIFMSWESIFIVTLLYEKEGRTRKRTTLDLDQPWTNNSREFGVVKIEEKSFEACRRTRLLVLRSELLCELHSRNKLVDVCFLVRFLAMSSPCIEHRLIIRGEG